MVSVFAWFVASMIVVTNAIDHPTEQLTHFLPSRRGPLYGSTATVLTARLGLEVALIFYPLFFLILIQHGFDFSKLLTAPIDVIETIRKQNLYNSGKRRLLLMILAYVAVFAPFRFFRLFLLYSSIEVVPASAGVAWSMGEGDPVKVIPRWADNLQTAFAAIHYVGIAAFVLIGIYWAATRGGLRGLKLK